MKIALCITGQPRQWKKCYSSWFSVFNKPDQNNDVDVFFHFWDSNTSNGSSETLVTKEEQDEIVSTLKPKKFLFETNTPIKLNTIDNIQRPIPSWCIPQFVSLQKVANLKRQYEIDQNIQYDMVVKLRGDLILNSDFGESHNPYLLSINWMSTIKPSTIYSIHSIQDSAGVRLSDIFFIADSLTFDHIALFQKSFKYLDLSHIFSAGESDPPPERFFYWFLHSVGINNHPLPFIEAKLVRDEKYLELLKNNNQKMGNHETII